MPEESPLSLLEQIAALFVSRGVEFLVIGGQAEYLFGSSRPTQDVDLCYKRDRANLERIAVCLRSIKTRLRGAPADLPFILDARTLEMGTNFTFTTELGDLDLLGYVEPIGQYEDLLPRHESYELGAFAVNTIGLDDLLRVKLPINRAKDQESIAQLKAIKRIREETQGS